MLKKMLISTWCIRSFMHGLQTPNDAFFHWNAELLGLGRQIGQINSGAFGVFSAELSPPILVHWVPNIYLGLGFEFGPQKIRNLAIMCPKSVVLNMVQKVKLSREQFWVQSKMFWHSQNEIRFSKHGIQKFRSSSAGWSQINIFSEKAKKTKK